MWQRAVATICREQPKLIIRYHSFQTGDTKALVSHIRAIGCKEEKLARLDPDFAGFGGVYYHCRYIERLFSFPCNCRNALNWLHKVATLSVRCSMNNEQMRSLQAPYS